MRYIISDINDITDALGKKSDGELRSDLDTVCTELATRFGLNDMQGKPRKAAIVDILASTTCISCISRKFSETGNFNRIDGIYVEVHKLAVSILIEDLYEKFSSLGCSVSILSEAQTKYGKVDVLIKQTRAGVTLQHGKTELFVEVKTGYSLSIPQIFRYLLDKEDQRVILWRIRNRQILTFDGTQFNALLRRYMKTIASRGRRLLGFKGQLTCKHLTQIEWVPTQHSLQEMLEDFSTALIETLPCIVKTIIKMLNLDVDNSAAPVSSTDPQEG